MRTSVTEEVTLELAILTVGKKGCGCWCVGKDIQAGACAKGQRYGVLITSGIFKVTLEPSSLRHTISP